MTGKFPHTLLIIVSFILLAGLATYLLPKGEYERKLDPATNREVVVSGSYHLVKAAPLSPFAIIVGVPRGIAAGVEVIITIFMCGACFYIVEKTGALKEGILFLTSRLSGRENSTLALIGVFFLAGGTLQGMEEEVIPLTLVLLMLGRRLGYNAFVMISVSYGAAVIGSSFSPFNPFGALLAQKIAGVPLLSAAPFRLVVMFVVFTVWMTMIIRYANRNRFPKEEDSAAASGTVSGRNGLILGIVVFAFALLMYGMVAMEWGFNELSAEFFVLGVLTGLIGKLGVNGTCTAYVEGFREMTFAALLVGFANSISVVLMDGKILDTIIYFLFIPMEGLPPNLSAIGMMFSQSLLHVLVPAYSGQAALTIPILAPLSDLIGLSRQVCVLAFQYGAILMNIISPTNGALMAIIALSGISYDKWFVFVGKRLLVIWGLGALALLVGGVLGI